jgi:hypothetical protein
MIGIVLQIVSNTLLEKKHYINIKAIFLLRLLHWNDLKEYFLENNSKKKNS